MKTVFISSTFKDMQAERDAIKKITLPTVNTAARSHNDEFDFCDLRWGVDTAEMETNEGSKKVLEVCLDEIDRCQPPMVVMLGYRYGWIPNSKLIENAAKAKEMQLEDLQKSVTALEIEYGAFKNCRTLYYFREIEGQAPEDYQYVHRVVANMTEDELSVIETSFQTYALRIKDKIEKLQDVYREKMFYKWLDSGKICCQEEYTFPDIITPADATSAIPLSLYDSECDDLNDDEAKLRDVFASTDTVEWWHRVIERKGFRINAFINHFPDFIVKMKSGRIIVVEFKGDHLGNDNSEAKLKLGKQWASKASETGSKYAYFMVFKSNPISGAYTLADFAEMLKTM